MAATRDDFKQAEAFLARHPAVRCVDLLLPDMNGVLRGKRVEAGDLRAVYERGMLLPGSMFALMLDQMRRHLQLTEKLANRRGPSLR